MRSGWASGLFDQLSFRPPTKCTPTGTAASNTTSNKLRQSNPSRLSRCKAAVYRENLAGDPLRVRRRKEQSGTCDIFRLTQSAKRMEPRQMRRPVGIPENTADELSLHKARANTIH